MKLQDCLFKSVCVNKCSEYCERYIQMERLFELSNLPENYRTPVKILSVDEDKPSYIDLANIKENIVDFVSKGKNLYICSSTCGNAKTTWAVKLMLRYFCEKWPNSYDLTRGLYIHVPKFLSDLKNFDNPPEYLSRITEADLVIWDDIALAKLSTYEHDRLLQFIDNRMANNKSNIYTSNVVNSSDLTKMVGGRLASRIYSFSKRITFNAGDFRVGGNLE